ncbi:MAG: DsbA family protein [Gammaproteobacteria bacterium]
MKVTLFYVHDPMCSWCYAFRDSFSGLVEHLPLSVSVNKVLGGLAPDTLAPMPVSLRQTLQQTWRRIEKNVPPVRFNFDFWTVNTPIRSTYPACRAVLAATKQGTVYEEKMIGAIQEAYYQQAKNPSLRTVLIGCAVEIGLDVDRFIQDLGSAEFDKELRAQIQLARNLGVSTFPSLRLQQGSQLSTICVDYNDFEVMLDRIVRLTETGNIYKAS